MMRKDVQLMLIRKLRANARVSLSEVSRESGVPVTTLFDNYAKLLSSGLVRKHSSVLDLRALGYRTRLLVLVSSRRKGELLGHLKDMRCVNSIYRISEYDFAVDMVFCSTRELKGALDSIGCFDIKALELHEVEEQLCFEKLLT